MSAETGAEQRRMRAAARYGDFAPARPSPGPTRPATLDLERPGDRPTHPHLPVVEPPAPAPAARFVSAGERVPRLPIEGAWARGTKRALDLAVGIPLFLLFLIAYPIVGLVLKITSPGPVIFAHTRVGRDGRPFEMLKFRSMYADAEDRLHADEELWNLYVSHGFKIPAAIDPRITPFGRFLRRTSIDELAQSICILKGSMSVVGPRPVVAEQVVELYQDTPRPYLACKPGLTGLWQVSGRAEILHEHRARLDIAYAEDWSLGGDVRILWRTMPVVLSARGAH
jgi:undecaprenyl-phosphate galactose phosphotransferase